MKLLTYAWIRPLAWILFLKTRFHMDAQNVRYVLGHEFEKIPSIIIKKKIKNPNRDFLNKKKKTNPKTLGGCATMKRHICSMVNSHCKTKTAVPNGSRCQPVCE